MKKETRMNYNQCHAKVLPSTATERVLDCATMQNTATVTHPCAPDAKPKMPR